MSDLESGEQPARHKRATSSTSRRTPSPALQHWIELRVAGVAGAELAEAEEAANRERQQAERRKSGQSSMLAYMGGPKRRRLTAVAHSWMHDSDMAIDSDSTDGMRSVQQQRHRAKQVGEEGSDVGGARPTSRQPAYRRVNVVPSARLGSAGGIGGGSAADEAGAAAAEAGASISIDEFGSQLLSQKHFAFGLHTESSAAHDEPPTPPYTARVLRGIAICWEVWQGGASVSAAAGGGDPSEAMAARGVPVVYYLPLADYAGTRLACGGAGSSHSSAPASDGSFDASEDDSGGMGAAAWSLLQTAMLSSSLTKISYDCKQQCALLLSRGVRIDGRLLDPRIAAWMLCPDGQESALSARKIAQKYYPALEAAISATATVGHVRDLCCRCTFRTISLMHRLNHELEQKRMPLSCVQQEMRISLVLARTELQGFAALPPVFRRERDEMRRRLDSLEWEGRRLLGHAFEWTSSKEVAELSSL